MTCPEEVARALLEIIQTACLSIRVGGWQNDARYCAVEANHIHNLPGLLLRFKIEELSYYLEVTREQYREEMEDMGLLREPSGYEEQWRVLEAFVGQT